MTLWIVFAAVIALALAWIGWPLLRPKAMNAHRDEYDAAVYVDQLQELERDRARGLIDESQAAAARIEIERRLLAAGRAQEQGTARAMRRPGFAAIVAVLVPLLAVFLYLDRGSPGLPNQPFAERTRDAAPVNSVVAAARERLAEAERRTQAAPDDPDAWLNLGRFQLVTGEIGGATASLARAFELSAGRPDVASAYGEALSRQADGLVTPEARRAFETALAGNPGDPRARYFLALSDFQEGREQQALEAWSALARSAPPNAPWLPTVFGRVAETARALGEDPADWLPRAPSQVAGDAPRGPNADDVAAAQQMAPEERMEMIRGMVANLAARLEEEPGNVEGWRRLARSYEVLGDTAASAGAYSRALALQPDDPETLLYGAIAAGQLGDADTAGERFTRLGEIVPPGTEVHSIVTVAANAIETNPQNVTTISQGVADAVSEQQPAPAPSVPAPSVPAPSVPAPDAAPQASRGPGAEDIAAAQQMSPEDRTEMIRGMVEGLAARLEDEPDDVEGWRQLARSREVLGEPAAAAQAYTRALALEPDHPETLLRGALAAGQLGDQETARARFVRLRDLVPPDSEVHTMVSEAIERIDAAGSR